MTPTINAPIAAKLSAAANSKPAGEAKQGDGGFTELLVSLSGAATEGGKGLKQLLGEAGLAEAGNGKLPNGLPHQLLDALAGASEGLTDAAAEEGAGMVEVGGVEIPLELLQDLQDALGGVEPSGEGLDGEALAAAAKILAALAGANGEPAADASGKTAAGRPEASTTQVATNDGAPTTDKAAAGAQPGQQASGEAAPRRAPVASASDGQPAADAPDASGGAPADTSEQGVVRTAGNASSNAEARASAQSSSGSEPAPASGATGPATPAGPQAPTAPAAAEGAPRLLQQQQPTASQQIGRAVLDQVSAGGGNARIQLDPPELGELLIRVRIDGDMVRIDIRAERPETAQMLRQGSLDLSGLLGDRGLDLLDVSVDHGGRDAWEMAREALDRQQRERGGDGSFATLLGIDGQDEGDDALRQYNRLRGAYNPDGELMYRV